MTPDAVPEEFLEMYGVVIVDRNGVICIWSKGAERILGHSAEEAIGQRVDMLVPEPYREMHWKGFYAAMENGCLKNPSPPAQLGALCKDGAVRQLPARLIYLTDSTGKGVGAMGVFG